MLNQLSSRLSLYLQLTRLNRPIGIWLLMWPTLWALFLAARGWPGLDLLLIFMLGTVLMRSAGCAVNDYADRDFDRHVKRTAMRPVTTGQVTPREALLVAGALTALAACLLVWLDPVVWPWALGAAVVATTYPFTKRFFALPQAYLGIAFSFGIPMAYAAVQAQVPLEAWLLLAANFFWTIAYDTEYAMVDRDDDLRLGMKTSAITFGRWDVVAVAACYGIALILLVMIGRSANLGLAYGLGLAVATALSVYHLTLIRDRDRQRCFRAFLHNTWWGAAVFVGLLLAVVVPS